MILFSVPGYADKPSDSELLIFVSFSMPQESLKLWAEQASRLGCPLLLRGFVDNDLTKTTAKTHALFGEKANIEISIDPEKFQKFNIDVVPAVVIVARDKVAIEKEGVDGSSVSHFDLVYGDTTLEEALKCIAKSGSPANQKSAMHYLKKYRDRHE